MAPPKRPPARPPPARPPPRSDTVPESPAVQQELSIASRRRVVRRPKEAPPKKSKAPLLIAVLLALGVAGAVAWTKTQKPPPPIVADPSIEQGKVLQVLFQEGKNLVRQGKWIDARAKFNAVVEQQPEFSEGAVKTYLAATEKEIPNQKNFDAAAAALEKGEVANAQRALNAVSPDTQQFARRDGLQEKLAAVFKQRLLEARDLAQSGGDLAKMKKLKTLADDLLVVSPLDRDATEFKALAEQALRPRGPEHVEIAHDDPGLEVQKLYAQGDASGALKAAADCVAASDTCRNLVDKMNELNALLKRLEGLSPGELDTALKLDRGISGGRSTPQARPISTRLAAVYYPKASAARAKGDWPAAMEHALKVVDADSGHAGAQAIVAEGRERAHDLYLRCYTQRATNADEAAPLCAEVVQMLPPGDATRSKAEKVLESMRAK